MAESPDPRGSKKNRIRGNVMSEKRKPEIVMLIRIPGKTKQRSLKAELFNALDFGHRSQRNYPRYRVRVDGKWFSRKGQQYDFMSKWEFRDLLFRQIL